MKRIFKSFKGLCIPISLLIILPSSIAFLSAGNAQAGSKEIPYTQDDRDRLIRMEEGLKAVNQRIDGLERSVNQRIDGLQDLMYVVIAAIFAQIVGVVGFVLWDRRTALAPAISKQKELEEREEKIEKALKEVALKDPNIKEALRRVGLL